MKTTLTLLTLLGIASVATAGTGDALSVMNAFLATFAKETPAWKSDIVLTTDSAHVPMGRQLGYSSMVGYYTFLPKTWEQLTDAEKEIVYGDPRLKPFIVSLRNTQNYPAMTSAEVPMPLRPSYPIEGFASPMPVSAPAGYYTPTAIPAAPAPAYNPYAPQGYAPAPVAPAGYAPAAPQATYAPYPATYNTTGSVPSAAATTYYFPVTVGGPVPTPVTSSAQPTYQYQPAPQAAPAAPAPVPYYLPTTSGEALARPLPVTYVKPQATRIRLAPEEMLLDRPLNVYMSAGR